MTSHEPWPNIGTFQAPYPAVITRVRIDVVREGFRNHVEFWNGEVAIITDDTQTIQSFEGEGIANNFVSQPDDFHRGVYGYFSWGFKSLETTDEVIHLERVWWREEQYINWRHSVFEPDRGANCIRVWGRKGTFLILRIGIADPTALAPLRKQRRKDGTLIFTNGDPNSDPEIITTP